MSCAKNPRRILRRISASSSKGARGVALSTPPLRCSVRPKRGRPCTRCAVGIRTANCQSVAISTVGVLSKRSTARRIIVRTRSTPNGPVSAVIVSTRALCKRCPPGVPRDRVGAIRRAKRVILDHMMVPRCIIMRSKTPKSSATTGCCIHCQSCVGGMTSDRVCTA